MMRIKTFIQTPFQQNTRVVVCELTRKAICIDPGEASDAVVDHIRRNEYDLRALFLTHGHLDHVGGTGYMHEQFPEADILIHKDEEPLYYALPKQPLAMGIPKEQLAALGLDHPAPPKITRNVEHGEVLEVGEMRFIVRHCPGHTLGHIVLIEENDRVVFTGDCLFSGTIGRTDLPGGDPDQLIDSIRKNLMTLDDEFVIHCGHGPSTTIGHERETNPFLTGAYDLRGRRV